MTEGGGAANLAVATAPPNREGGICRLYPVESRRSCTYITTITVSVATAPPDG